MPDSRRFAQRILPVARSSTQRPRASQRGAGCASGRHPAHASCGNCELRVPRRAKRACGVACSAKADAQSTNAPIESRPTRATACRWDRTCWIGVSTAGSPIAPGSAISRWSGRAKAGGIWQRFSIWRAVGSWARQCPNALTLTWSVRHCAARGGTANRRRACCYIPTGEYRRQAGHTGS